MISSFDKFLSPFCIKNDFIVRRNSAIDLFFNEDLPEEIYQHKYSTEIQSDSLKEIEKQHILKIFSENNSNKSITAEKLGIGAVTLYRKLKEYGVD